MSVGRVPRNTVQAGLFVIVCIALAVVCVIVLSNVRERLTPKSEYIVRFSILDGAEGLDEGAAVKVGGKRVGSVTGVRFEPDDGEPLYVDVEISIDRRIRLFDDADTRLVKPLLGTGSTINIVPGGGRLVDGDGLTGPAKPLAAGEMILGRPGAPGFIAPSDYARLQSIIARVDSIVADVQPRIGAIVGDAEAAVANVRAITDDARARWPQWGQQFSGLLDQIERERRNLEGIGKAIADGVQEVRDFVARGQAVVDENRPAIREAIESARQFVAKVNGEAYDKILAAIEDGRAALNSVRATAEDVNGLIAEKSPELSDTITNAALAAQQLKLATTEIRASPWRLLYQPTKKELENELLYNSVRQYANAVSELRYAADSLNAVTRRAPGPNQGGAVDTESINRLTAKLREAFDQYQQQEREFLERWVKTDR